MAVPVAPTSVSTGSDVSTVDDRAEHRVPRGDFALDLRNAPAEDRLDLKESPPGTGVVPQGTPADPEAASPEGVDPVQPLALPTGADKSGVTSQAISVPDGAGKIQGMEESFSAQLSTGIATFSVPFALPKARGGAQPSLGLSYSSSGGRGVAGQGWSVGVPFIARQTDRGLPTYDDRDGWHPNQDRFVFNGGQELVPICTVDANLTCLNDKGEPVALPDTGAGPEAMPPWAGGHQYFRARVEGSFLRFFWAPDHKTWRVQDKSGTTMELGMPLDGSGDMTAIEQNSDPAGSPEYYRWHLVRQYDQHGDVQTTTPKPINVVVYKYFQDGGQAYLSDIFDTTPAQDPTTSDLSQYAHHTRLVWEARTDPTESYRSGWLIESRLRLRRVDVASKAFEQVSEARRQVRRYHLVYDAASHVSLLTRVQVEGRCSGDEASAPAEDDEQKLADSTAAAPTCPILPPMEFGYTRVQPHETDGSAGQIQIPGYEGFDARIRSMAGSPPHSVDEALTDLYDVNSDGLPDILVTAPGLYNDGHAVFFNGPNGAANTFGSATEMGVIGGVKGTNASTITLRNLNLAALDLDGDAVINLLHMPRVKTYAIFTPQKIGGRWMWSGRAVDTADGQSPKIDWGRDTLDTQVVDVNFDGLVDVVVSTGTQFQTFYSLGRYPGGDGQFGRATRLSAATASIDNSPVRTCVPHSGSPVRFSDGETKLADMNGDGITDIVRIRRGDIRYWPGRGNGFWGTGRRNDCPEGTFGANRHVTMASAPWYSDVEGTTLRIDDVNGDGLSDLVQVRFDAVDVWLNVDGRGWTKRHIIDKTPASPSYANRVRLVDVNGSGTRDILWGDGRSYKYIDLQGGQQSWLLNEVKNGLGKSTEIEYSTSTAEMLAAEARAASGNCSGVGPWCEPWRTVMPTVTQVVKRVIERDNITIAGRPPAAYVTEYEYRDPVFEGRQREFRGFKHARARRLGDANSPTDLSESTFLLGECRDPETGSVWDGVDQAHFCAPPRRWEDNPFEALKGLPVVTERYDASGKYLSSTHNGYEVRTLYRGLDGRAVRHAFLSETNSFLYDTATVTQTPGSGVDLASVMDADFPGAGLVTRVTPRAGFGVAQLRSSSRVDLFGNKTATINEGCVAGSACPDGSETGIAAEESITQVTTPALQGYPSQWMWRTVETFVCGAPSAAACLSQTPAEQRNHTRTTYDTLGRPVKIEAELIGSLALDRLDSGAAPADASTDRWIPQSTTAYDGLGLATRTRAPNGRCAQVAYDTTGGYGLFAVGEEISTGDTNPVEAIGTACTRGAQAGDDSYILTTGATYDQGLAVVKTAVDMNGNPTQAGYDGFGRIVELRKPLPSGGLPTNPSVTIAYFLPDQLGGNHSIIHTKTEDGTNPDQGEYLESYAYVDGFGRTLATLTEADTSAGDDAPWIAGGLIEWDQKSAVAKKYLEFFWDGDPLAFDYSSQPTTAYGRQRYDAFGRQVQTFDLDGTVTLQSAYHALSTDLWDAADLAPGPHHSSFASERKDGHGRTIATTERFRASGAMETREVRTRYLSTGEPEVITRVNVTRQAQPGFDPVVRWMRYDSLGRMVLNAEPNTTDDFSADPSTPADAMKAWRYQYNDAGDLIGTSDARQCGQNFYYDGAGRITGEDYVPCEPHHAAYSDPDVGGSGLDPDALEVVYVYDDVANVPGGVGSGATCAGGQSVGRAVAVLDRGSATLTQYDHRGRTTHTCLRVAKPQTRDANGKLIEPTSLAARYAPRWYSRSTAFDAADREVQASTGVESLRDAANAPLQELLSATNDSFVTTDYTRRGTLKSAGSSYGSLISNIDRTADGLVKSLTYGDAAGTTTAYLYDERRRISSVQTYRGPPASWESPPPDYLPAPAPGGTDTTFQLLLQDEDFRYDAVGNPVEIRDWRNPAEWPAGARPVTKKIQYDDLYRATRIDYVYSAGDDQWVSPFADEVASGGEATDARRAPPSPHVAFDKRVLRQTFQYDWLGNTAQSGDDADGFYDRSLGTIENATAGTAGVTEAKPYQLRSASNIAGTADGREGQLWTKYDAAGNLTRLDLRRMGPCLPAGDCSQRFEYRWDEVGRLERARRWDTSTDLGNVDGAVPGGTPAADLRYVYDAADQRILKEAVDAAGVSSHTVYLFPTLELRRTGYGDGFGYDGSPEGVADYEVDRWTAVPYLLANGVRLARLAYEETTAPSRDPAGMTGEAGAVNASTSQLHVFFELGDHLGSTSVVLDKATGELVERSTFLGYGATESDYRPARWEGFREDYKFTGKEEDVEVGLQYFGKRFLNPYLGRWVSADPLAVHVPGEADLNVFAYVSGQVLRFIDPLGLEKNAAIRVNNAPEGVAPGQYFFQGAGSGTQGFATIDELREAAAAQGVPVFQYDPSSSVSMRAAQSAPEIFQTLANLRALSGETVGDGGGQGGTCSGPACGTARGGQEGGSGPTDLGHVIAMVGGIASGDTELQEGGSSRGSPGGNCPSCGGSKAQQMAIGGARLASTIVPGSTLAARTAHGIKRGREVLLGFKTLNEARSSARQFAGLGDDAVNFVQEIGPLKGRVTGRQSRDGLRGWRIDFDPNDPAKGFHVNWWDRSGGTKRDKWFYGVNVVEGGTYDDYLELMQHFP